MRSFGSKSRSSPGDDRPARRGATERRAPTLQDRLGNRAVARLLALRRQGALQPALKVGRTDDPLEREADRFADGVGCGCSPDAAALPSRAPAAPEPVLRRREDDTAPAGGTVDGLDLGPGSPLDPAQQKLFESKLGENLGGVRVHTGEPAGRAAEGLGARAFTVGRDIAFGPNEYRPDTTDGRHVLAHELAHVVQQGGTDTGTLRRDPKPAVSGIDRYRRAGPVDWRPGMRATLVSDIDDRDAVQPYVRGVKGGSLVEVVSNPSYGQIEVRLVDPKAQPRKSWWINDVRLEPVGVPIAAPDEGSPGGGAGVPVTVQYELLGRLGDDTASGQSLGVCTPYSDDFGLGPAALRSSAIGTARGLGFLISPPVRGPLDPWLPLASRLGEPEGPLGLTGESAILERYLTSPAGELTPRYASEAGELALSQFAGQSWWQNNFGLTELQLSQMPDLVARISRDGMASLAPAEQQLVMTFLRSHAESVAAPGLKIASPAISTTSREALSAVPEAAPLFREAPYVVRIQVPAEAVMDVNATMGASRMPGLVYEQEVLVFTDARGAITRVMPNPASTLGRATPLLRWAGRGFLVIGAGISIYRIANASPRELPRVIGEETGGWVGGMGGSALAAGACIAFGIATEGIGLFLCGAVGGLGGGLAGSYLGGEAGEAAGNRMFQTMQTAGEVFTPLMERAIWGDKPIPPLGYVPPPLFGQRPF